jgi:hypothetical protein
MRFLFQIIALALLMACNKDNGSLETSLKSVPTIGAISAREIQLQSTHDANELKQLEQKYLLYLRSELEKALSNKEALKPFQGEASLNIELQIFVNGTYVMTIIDFNGDEKFKEAIINLFKTLTKFESLPAPIEFLRVKFPLWYQ